MNINLLLVALAIVPCLPASAYGHRLDEYLQAALISLEKDHVQVAMRLVPGVAVSDFVLKSIDTNADGVISQSEQQAYAERVLRDVSLAIDARQLRPRIISMEFPRVEDMREGLGEIRIEFSADFPLGGPKRSLTFENHHQRAIAAYLVNCLVPRDPDIRVVAQNRSRQQSSYQLDYVQAGVSPIPLVSGWQDERVWLSMAALFLFARFAILWRQAHGPTRL